ncbi:MAG: DUF885 domain-containing protein [Polyangiaceae bacterium]|nr:DUF885 domain-containing protein [Polyangiaceae bacterium]
MLAPATPNAFTLSDELLETLCELRPVSATLYGVPGHDHLWDDFSPAGAERVATALRDLEQRAAALPPPATADERLAKVVLDEVLSTELARLAEGDHLSDLNSIASPLQNLRLVFDAMGKSSRDGWRDVAERLHGLERACAGYREALDEGLRTGRAVARRQVLAAIREARVHAAEGSYFASLPRDFAAARTDDPALLARLVSGAEAARRAYGALADWLEQTYLPRASSGDAVGRERYLRLARRFLGIDIDPVETFAWGLEEVRSIGARMREVALEVAPGASVAEALALLKSDPARSAPNAAAFVEIMAARQAHALADLAGRHFDVPEPVRRIEVRLAPKGGALGAYYLPPSEDWSRPGTVWYQPGDDHPIPLYGEVSTAYHEGFPGHHLQCGIQVSLRGKLSRLHRVAVESYLGFVEGWALYAERLMEELGYYEKPDYVLGMLSQQMMRACRVALDIGAHLELELPASSPFRPGARVDYEHGVAMLTEVAGLPLDQAESEMTRYLGWPGQAIAYKVGERAILELREEVRRRDGAAFDLRAFHARLLGNGAVGLATMRELVLAG